MTTYTTHIMTTGLTAQGLKNIIRFTDARPFAETFTNFVTGCSGGAHAVKFVSNVGAVQATGSLTITSTGPTNGETFSVANVTFTAETSGATGNQFNINATAGTVAKNIAAAVNASANLAGIVTAVGSGTTTGTVTFTAVVPGLPGNGLQLSESLTNTTATAFASGSDGTAYTNNLGMP